MWENPHAYLAITFLTLLATTAMVYSYAAML
jgi:hypothetical protein